MDRCMVSSARHQPIEDVELAHEMTLADPADRWIARHLPGIFGAKRKQSDTRTPSGGGSRSLASGMAGADHQNVEHVVALADQCFT